MMLIKGLRKALVNGALAVACIFSSADARAQTNTGFNASLYSGLEQKAAHHLIEESGIREGSIELKNISLTFTDYANDKMKKDLTIGQKPFNLYLNRTGSREWQEDYLKSLLLTSVENALESSELYVGWKERVSSFLSRPFEGKTVVFNFNVNDLDPYKLENTESPERADMDLRLNLHPSLQIQWEDTIRIRVYHDEVKLGIRKELLKDIYLNTGASIDYHTLDPRIYAGLVRRTESSTFSIGAKTNAKETFVGAVFSYNWK